MSDTDGLVEWLTGVLDATEEQEWARIDTDGVGPASLARIDAERAIIALHYRAGTHTDARIPFCAQCGSGDEEYPENWPCPTLRLLARGHRHDAPGYDMAWAPEGVEVGT